MVTIILPLVQILGELQYNPRVKSQWRWYWLVLRWGKVDVLIRHALVALISDPNRQFALGNGSFPWQTEGFVNQTYSLKCKKQISVVETPRDSKDGQQNKPQPSGLTSSPIITQKDSDKKIVSVEDGITSLPEMPDGDISAFKRVTYWQQAGTNVHQSHNCKFNQPPYYAPTAKYFRR